MADNDVLDAILSPDPDNAAMFLDRLGLGPAATPEQIHREIEEKLLLPSNKLPDHWLPTYQIRWQPKLSIPSLLTSTPTPPPTSLSFSRVGLDGRVIGYTEVANHRGETGLTSTSLDRAPGPSKNFVRGKSGYVPFWPGGLDAAARDNDGVDGLISGEKGMRTVAPGLSRGMRLPGEVVEEDFFELPDAIERPLANGVESSPTVNLNDLKSNGVSDIDEFLPVSRANLNPVGTARRLRKAQIEKRDWAHVVDINKKMNNFHELVPDMAHKYPFELDTFQKEAVYHLEMGDSVFVAAHTSAGKTVVAEYAIALAQKHMTRAIYTSPIKALSNQKFRDFKQTFSSASVGILTGDVQINPEANCLIMTTEILRSMLYKGADLIRDVEFVIFDEVHYVNDAERGVVWEEVIIMLPEHVSIILLSATVPNTKEFAEWVGRTKKKDIYVISTAQRPVPLEHYLYAGKDMHKIVDSQGNFLLQGYNDSKEALRRKQDKEREAAGLPPVQRLGARAAAPQRGTQRGGQRGGAAPARGRAAAPVAGGGQRWHQADKNVYVHLVGHLKKKALLPVVVFTFSKRRCEEYAGTLMNTDLSTAAERSEVHITVERALSRLKGSDKKLPQIARMRDLLSRGIGVHHGGLLPIVKEVVELLFARGLVKVLFATETFAMGVNMPAKCVVYSSIRKHDGRSFRDILPGEYTQMAGRAGRRGLDPTGTVIINANDDCPEQTTLRTMILGTPTKLQSQFRLTYNMILNLLRVEALKVEEMIKRSFSENASQRLLPDQQKKVIEGESKLAVLPKLSCDVCGPDIERFYDLNQELVDLNQKLLGLVAAGPRGSKSIISPGRVVVLRDEHFDDNLAILLRPGEGLAVEGVYEKTQTFYVLALVDEERKSNKRDIDPLALSPRWPPKSSKLTAEQSTYDVRIVPLTSIAYVTNSNLKIDVHEILDVHLISSLKNAARELEQLATQWTSSTALLPEVDWARQRTLDFQETLRRRDSLLEKTSGVACTMCSNFEEHYSILHTEKVLRQNIALLKMAISDQNLELIPDYEQRIEVLQDLQFIDENSTVLLKGRVACEINSANELVLTELILENTFASYSPEEVVALLSCFVFQEKTDVEPKLTEKLEEGKATLIAISDRVEAIQTGRKVADSEFKMMKFGLMEVIYNWAKGMPFEEIATMTDVAEGTIVRVITRLDETCREVRDAARVIGDAVLMKKMEEAQSKIRRDIVFAASLYF